MLNLDFYLLIGTLITCALALNPLEIKTTAGIVRGITKTSDAGKEVDAWYGIPYGEPPTGKLRFKKPLPANKWDDIKDVHDLPNSCYQLSVMPEGSEAIAALFNPNTELSEDCLYLSVVVPKPRGSKLPVMVWIHGGGFMFGTSTTDLYDGKILSSENNVIVVNVQYRIGALGFLYMGTEYEDVSSNAGLLDQRLALQWVSDNIEYFGGDKESITIFGESAGSASVGFHLLSPDSQKFFTRGILQSGTPLAPWATNSREECLERSLSLAKELECYLEGNTAATVECLREADPMSIIVNQYKVKSKPFESQFAPFFDNSFLTESPQETLEKGTFKKTSVLLGGNRDEGGMLLWFTLPIFREENIKISKSDFANIIDLTHSHYDDIVKAAFIHEYTDWSHPDCTTSNLDALDKLVGDWSFMCNINEFGKYYAQKENEVYMYQYAHMPSQTPWPKWAGVWHSDEVPFVFGMPLSSKLDYTREEKEFSKKIMKLWVNFAKTGSPVDESSSIKWPLYTPSEQKYLILNTDDEMQIGEGLRVRQCAFWTEFLPKLINYTQGATSNEDSSATDTTKQEL